ncbi:MAG: uroporphyrinogen-III C-methyltransferase [Myxococcota bacterium]|nr:uroporphyrinogen-III C-methyltransferase [Myxococcota bacterium]
MGESTGTVYLVGAGPGDPGLLTVRGAALLRRADAVVFDHLANSSLLELAPASAEIRDVGKSGDGPHQMSQEGINDLLVEMARRRRIVVRLKGGDPFVLGRGGEEMIHLRRAGVPCVVVPGVTSATAVPACAGIPVTHRRVSATATIVTGHEDPTKDGPDVDWAGVARAGGTIVSLMGMSRIDAIASALVEGGRPAHTPAAAISWGCTPRRRVVAGTLGDIAERSAAAGIGAPGILVVGDVVRLREEIMPPSALPLAGRTVLVTRSRGQASRLVEALCDLGAAAVEAPAFRVVPPLDPEALRTAARKVGEYDWVVLTSANGVAALFDALAAQDLDARAFGSARVAAIGPGTAAALADRGVRADLVPERFIAEGILEALADRDAAGRRFLLCRAQEAGDALPEGLRERGARAVDEICAYRLQRESPDPWVIERIDRGEIDAVTFTSGSTVRGLRELLGEDRFAALGRRAAVVSIGPITSAEARRMGLDVAAEAAEHSIPGLVAALVRHFGGEGRQGEP